MTEKPLIIYLHIPKAAGSTFRDILKRQCPGETFWQPRHMTLEAIQSLTEEQKSQIQALRGQMFFGLHEVFLPRPFTYITFLRHPVDRMISWYYYILRTPGNWFHKTVVSQDMALEDFIYYLRDIRYDNQLTRWIAGILPAQRPDDTTIRPLEQIAVPDISDFPLEVISEESLMLAKHNLKTHFGAIGLTEHFDESVILMRQFFGWDNVYYFKKNVTLNRPLRDGETVPPAIKQMISEQEYLDIQLYEFARQMFEKKVQQAGAGFQKEVQTFQRKNLVYNRVRRFSHKMPSGFRSAAKHTLGYLLFGRAVKS